MAQYDADTAIGGTLCKFPDTRHSLVLAASSGHEGIAREALGAVIEVYWKPVYKYVRWKWNRSNEGAKDLVQGFFAALMAQEILDRFDPARGTFRSYLRVCLDHYVLKQDEWAHRLKRGGELEAIPLDFESAESELALIPPHSDSPEDLFYREWQRQIFALAVQDLRALCHKSGKDLQFRIFARYDLAEEGRPRYDELAAEHRVPVATVTNYLAWSRRELRRLALERLAAVKGSRRDLFG